MSNLAVFYPSMSNDRLEIDFCLIECIIPVAALAEMATFLTKIEGFVSIQKSRITPSLRNRRFHCPDR